jgi:hypothetical protein
MATARVSIRSSRGLFCRSCRRSATLVRELCGIGESALRETEVGTGRRAKMDRWANIQTPPDGCNKTDVGVMRVAARDK